MNFVFALLRLDVVMSSSEAKLEGSRSIGFRYFHGRETPICASQKQETQRERRICQFCIFFGTAQQKVGCDKKLVLGL